MAFGKNKLTNKGTKESKGQFVKLPTPEPVIPTATQMVNQKQNSNVAVKDAVLSDVSNILTAYNKYDKAIEKNNKDSKPKISLKEAWKIAKSDEELESIYEELESIYAQPTKSKKVISAISAMALDFAGVELIHMAATNIHGIGEAPLVIAGLALQMPAVVFVNDAIYQSWQKFKAFKERNRKPYQSSKDRFPRTRGLLNDYKTMLYYRTTEERRVGVIIKSLAAEFALAGGAIAYASTQGQDLKTNTIIAAASIISLSILATPALLRDAKELTPKHFIGSADGSGGGDWI